MEEVESIKFRNVQSLGMILTQVTYKSCNATIATGEFVWATIYSIQSSEEGKGHCQELCKQAKEFYSQHGKVFGSSIAIHPAMKHILEKLDITEYKDEI